MGLRLTKLPPVRVVACCSWFDEDPKLLRGMVESLGRANVDTLVAVDGRYRLFGKELDDFRSPPEQHAALWAACADNHITLIDDLPTALYSSEREKRQRLFSLAESYATPGDWLLWIDGDESVGDWLDPERSLSEHLRGTALDVAEVTFIDHAPREGVVRHWQIPRFFRAGKFSHMGPNHYTLIARDGGALWGNTEYRTVSERVIVPQLIEHNLRAPERAAREAQFIADRDRLEPEAERIDRSKLAAENFPLAGEYEVRTT